MSSDWSRTIRHGRRRSWTAARDRRSGDGVTAGLKLPNCAEAKREASGADAWSWLRTVWPSAGNRTRFRVDPAPRSASRDPLQPLNRFGQMPSWTDGRECTSGSGNPMQERPSTHRKTGPPNTRPCVA